MEANLWTCLGRGINSRRSLMLSSHPPNLTEETVLIRYLDMQLASQIGKGKRSEVSGLKLCMK